MPEMGWGEAAELLRAMYEGRSDVGSRVAVGHADTRRGACSHLDLSVTVFLSFFCDILQPRVFSLVFF